MPGPSGFSIEERLATDSLGLLDLRCQTSTSMAASGKGQGIILCMVRSVRLDAEFSFSEAHEKGYFGGGW